MSDQDKTLCNKGANYSAKVTISKCNIHKNCICFHYLRDIGEILIADDIKFLFEEETACGLVQFCPYKTILHLRIGEDEDQ